MPRFSVLRSFLLPAMLALALAGALVAEPPPGPRSGKARARGGPLARPRTPIDRWNLMTPEQRERALRRLPPERRERIRAQIARFNSLPPREQQRLRERYARLAALPPDRQDLVRGDLRRLNQMPPERRRAVAREMRQLRNMPEAGRAARMESEAFRTSYSPEERRILEDLSENLVPPSPE